MELGVKRFWRRMLGIKPVGALRTTGPCGTWASFSRGGSLYGERLHVVCVRELNHDGGYHEADDGTRWGLDWLHEAKPTIEPALAPPNPILNSDSGPTSITTLASRETNA